MGGDFWGIENLTPWPVLGAALLGTIVKYIKCQSLREVMVDNSFGCVKLYIPSDWSVALRVDESFGHVKTFGNGVADSCNSLNMFVDTSFGDVEIHYILGYNLEDKLKRWESYV